MSAHPGDERLQRFADGELSEAEKGAILYENAIQFYGIREK